jgi:L-ribulose-5-phosphate 3-epimerase
MGLSATAAPRIPFGAITDEFSHDLSLALPAMEALGMSVAELRVIGGRNILDLTDQEIETAHSRIKAHGMSVVSIASPLLKCVLPGGPPLDDRFQQDAFASRHTFDDQPRLTRRAFDIAHLTDARIVRVFSYWRTIDPTQCFAPAAEALRSLATEAWAEDLIIGLENEHACNVGTASELARMLAEVDHPGLRAVWDPANSLVAGEDPFPSGYAALPAARIVHVHAKDCTVSDHRPTWGLLGAMGIDWQGQVRALLADGYTGAITLETHWQGPHGDKLEASTLCGRELRGLVA